MIYSCNLMLKTSFRIVIYRKKLKFAIKMLCSHLNIKNTEPLSNQILTKTP